MPGITVRFVTVSNPCEGARNMAFCIKCGMDLPGNMQFCTACGSPVEKAVSPDAEPVPFLQPGPVQPTYQGNTLSRELPPEKGSRHAVIGTFGYIGICILFAIPIVGLISSIKWAFGTTGNLNRRNLARAYLIFLIVSIGAGIFLWITVSAALAPLWEYIPRTPDGQSGGFENILGLFKNLFTESATQH